MPHQSPQRDIFYGIYTYSMDIDRTTEKLQATLHSTMRQQFFRSLPKS
ncbi:MAG: hypothetical protein KKD01_13220 [Proteobacteria bacterium]|nr:hypothetical protein [Pseudomonadota bacterium]MBU1137645.1 hypothetical protein [Pseudomonadota bacterium]MBU1233605.1 hypothetical protein [Pseudomonadota bacterium]MBU1418897.1 hypothetical protein [Pseudomonadota bacterium]MBU1455679.1 hypothetical protein [Pseudomonadota bacterium]